MTEIRVGRRLVVHLGGYDPVPPEAAYGRFVRELGRFRRAWSATAEAGPLRLADDLAAWPVGAGGPNWSVQTDLRLLRWDDVMARESRAPLWLRLGRGLRAGADFALGGALRRYCRHAWRYALFFLYPYLLLGGIAAVAALCGWLLALASGSAVLGIVAGAGLGAALTVWAGGALKLNHLLDDWIFASRYLRASDPVIDPRLDALAAALVRKAGSGRYDEVVIVGHSLGAVLAIELADKALALDPRFGLAGARAALVTVGSSIPKLGLHRDARRLRDAIARVAAAPGLFWVEYQALTDPMNFYKLNPARLLGAGASGPVLRTVRISRMLDRAYYKRIQRNFFRVHNQFVSGNDLRAPYDYFMLVAGPFLVEELARAADGAASRLGPDGSLLPPDPASAGRAAAPGLATTGALH